MATPVPSYESLKREALHLFVETFGEKPAICISAPGRVNLIGEHTDYNDGFVLPMALPLVTVIVGNKNTDDKCSIITNSRNADEPRKIEFAVPNKTNLSPGKPAWFNYVKGVLANFIGNICAFKAAVVTSVPLGGGLASSASLEVAFYTFLEELTGQMAPSLEAKALACQKGEHEFPQMPCGIMDQFISVMGRENNALLIDCRSMKATAVPLNDPSVVVLITNSNVRHELTGSEYSSRRNICKEAAKLLGKENLRDVSADDLQKLDSTVNEEMLKRVRHVVTEIQRTVEAAEALKKNDYVLFGKLMTDSHNSLRDDFEVSCPEVDQLVELAMEVEGVFGSRMTGGGFGGCTVTLVKVAAVDNAISHMKEHYKKTATFYVCTPCNGPQVLSLD